MTKFIIKWFYENHQEAIKKKYDFLLIHWKSTVKD